MNKTIEVNSSASSGSVKRLFFDLDLYKKNSKPVEKFKKSKVNLDASLPFIPLLSGDAKNVKINVIRRQSENTEDQIILMKARIKALKEMKNKIETKKQKSLQKIEFIQTVRQRKHYESVQKFKQKQKQEKQLEDLKQKARQLREGLKKQISKAKQTIYLKNLSMAQLKKQQQAEISTEISLKNQKQLQSRLERMEKIKNQEAKHNQMLKEFQLSRIKYAEQNHKEEAQKQFIEKQKKIVSLQRLKQEQLKSIQELKAAEKDYQEIVKLNPEGVFLEKLSRVSIKSRINR